MAYVLTQETDECLLWNPLTGQCHKQFDPFCPLQSVDCLFNDKNVSIWIKKKTQVISSCHPEHTLESPGNLEVMAPTSLWGQGLTHRLP